MNYSCRQCFQKPVQTKGARCEECKRHHAAYAKERRKDPIIREAVNAASRAARLRAGGHRAISERTPKAFLYRKLMYAATRARKKSLEFTLDIEWLVNLWGSTGAVCSITGLQMVARAGYPESVSIDRVNHHLGYTPENCQLVCTAVNLAKRDFGDKQIRDWILRLRGVLCDTPASERESSES